MRDPGPRPGPGRHDPVHRNRMHAAHRLYERRGYLRQPARDWQIRNVRLLAYRLVL